MPPATTRTIIGLVGARGSAGVLFGQPREWRLVFDLVAWRHPGSAVVIKERRCEMPVPKADLSSLTDRVKPDCIIEAEIDDAGSTTTVTKIGRIVQVGASDSELEQLVGQLQQPIVLHDAELGRLEYDRQHSWFAGRAKWCGQTVDVNLQCARPIDPMTVLSVAARLFGHQAEWDRRVRDYAVEKLLVVKNISLLDEGKQQMSAQEFLSKMRLESIWMDESAELTFWHNDGGIFLGHAIQIRGSLSGGLTGAVIAE